MTRSLMIVESRPASTEDEAAYHDWYDNTHIPELLAVPAVLSASRYRSVDGDTFLAVYEADGDVATVQAAIAQGREARSAPVGMSTAPPPAVRWFESI